MAQGDDFEPVVLHIDAGRQHQNLGRQAIEVEGLGPGGEVGLVQLLARRPPRLGQHRRRERLENLGRSLGLQELGGEFRPGRVRQQAHQRVDPIAVVALHMGRSARQRPAATMRGLSRSSVSAPHDGHAQAAVSGRSGCQ